jgi:DNA-binding MarR family transcriptional regulator
MCEDLRYLRRGSAAAAGHRSSPGRLEVARAIATEPRTAGEISALWHIDPTLVNRHLRALAAAGLARTAGGGERAVAHPRRTAGFTIREAAPGRGRLG